MNRNEKANLKHRQVFIRSIMNSFPFSLTNLFPGFSAEMARVVPGFRLYHIENSFEGIVS
jgi:hypothetical protein